MANVKITVWAFDNFSKFDLFLKNGFGITDIKSCPTVGRDGQVKMSRVSTDISGMMSALLNHDNDAAAFESLRSSLFKKDGGLRKLAGRSVKYVTDGFFVTFDFESELPVYEMVSGGFEYYIVKKGSHKPVYQSGDVHAVIKELERLNGVSYS